MNALLGPLVAILLPLSLGIALPDTDGGNGTIWAVLVAGSNGFYNYRHQADVCHAYQIFRRHGVPDSQIITMMYDDIAYHTDNPKKGKIYNKPNGENVYEHMLKDYTGDAVNPHNFMQVLTGNSSGILTSNNGKSSGKVLRSGPNDHVFVNFADHGGTGVILFPDDKLHAQDLIATLQQMQENNMFKRLVFYMEACESGSMFKNLLPSNIEVYAATAANSRESSFGCYCEEEVFEGNCLGDEFSVAWMEDIDTEDKVGNLTSETLLKQFQKVKSLVKKSHPQMFGEVSMKEEVVTDFFGNSTRAVSASGDDENLSINLQGLVSSREVTIHVLNKKIERASGLEKKKLHEKKDALIKGRETIDQLFHRIVKTVSSMTGLKVKDIEDSRPDLTLAMTPCYKTLVDSFYETCVNVNKNTYALAHLYKLANICLSENISIEDVQKIYQKECFDGHRGLRNID